MLTARIAIAAALASLLLFAGWQVNQWRTEAREAAGLRQQLAAVRADHERAVAVSTAYQQVRAELERIRTVNRMEVQREIVRPEYRCSLPDDGRRLLDAAVDAANAAAGGPRRAVPGP